MKKFYIFLNLFVAIFLSVTLSYAQDAFEYDETITTGGGYTNSVLWGDFNGDGYQDLYVTNGHQSASAAQNVNYLFKNNGDGTFDSLATVGTIVTEGYVSGGGSWGDYDNDGDLDMFVAEVYRVPAVFPNDYTTIYSLYTNNGDGTFSKSDSHGDLTVETQECGVQASWADSDNDGYLDLAISTQHIKFMPTKENCALYLNDQDGTFTKQNNAISALETRQGGLSWADYDDDGDQDIVFVAGYEFQITTLFNNTGTDFSTSTTLENEDAKGASWGDYDNDGDLDLLIAISGAQLDAGSKAQANILYRNDAGTLTQVAAGELTTDTLYTQTSAWGDYDNDGDLDVYIGNSGGLSEVNLSYIYVNDGAGSFSKLAGTVVSDSGKFVRTSAWADYDNDGDLDLMTGRDGKNRLFKNVLDNGNHFLNIELSGVTANRSGIGSIVRVKASINGEPVWLMRDVSGQTGFGGQNSLRAHFGLGDATIADSVEVYWAGSSTVDKFKDVPVDQFMKITEGQASDIHESLSAVPGQFVLNQNYPNPFNPTTKISYNLPFAAKTTLEVFSLNGQKVMTVEQGVKSAGFNTLELDASALSSGVYLYRLSSGGFSAVKKFILLK